jgi:phytoene desaturase
MLYLGVEGRFDQLAHHNIYVAKDYRRNLDEIERQHVLSEDPSFYVENPACTDATMAPPGHSALYVLLPVAHQHPNVDWSTYEGCQEGRERADRVFPVRRASRGAV